MLDFTTVVLMLTCFAMRLILWVDVWPNTFYNGEPTGGMSVFVDVREGFVPVAPETRVVLTQFIQIFFSVSALLVFLRSCEALSIVPVLGVLFAMINSMITDSMSILFVLVYSALATGVSLSGLMASGMVNTEAFNKPFWLPFRALLGDFDFQVVYDTVGDESSPGQNFMVVVALIIIWVYVYFSTIVIINLMIAKMTQSYERISEEATLFRKYAMVDIIQEYKDKRSAIPPPFILFISVFRFANYVISGKICTGDDDDKETGFSDKMWYSRTEEYLKIESKAQAEYLKELESDEEIASRLDDAAQDMNELREEVSKQHEMSLGRFDRLEASIAKVKGKASGIEKAGPTDTSLGRPSYVSPGRLAPINYVQDAAYTKGSYPPTSARPRHEALQPKPSPMYDGAGVGAAYGRPALAAVRESQAYLNSVAGLPLTSHRSAPRLAGQPRSSTAAQADLQLMDSARRVFDLYDRDRSGDIDSRELQPALRDLGLVDVDSVQSAAILSKYDLDKSSRLDFVEFTQLLQELRDFQSSAQRAAAEAPLGGAQISVAGGGMGSGYYSADQIRALQEAAARQAAIGERARLEGRPYLVSPDDSGPPP